jgi:hypothetical protein
MTNVALLDEANGRGVKLAVAGENLTVQPASRCPGEFAATLREHKASLLALFRLRFLMVRSAVLNETVFFAADEATKTELVNAGAEPSCIYTCDELSLLIEQHRREPITAAELLQIHRARRAFNARIANEA